MVSLRATSDKLQATSDELQATSDELQATSVHASRARDKFQTSAICHTFFINILVTNRLSIAFLWQMFPVFLYIDEKMGIFASRQAQIKAKQSLSPPIYSVCGRC